MFPLNMMGFNENEPWFVEEAMAGSNAFRFLYCMGRLARNQEHEAFAILQADARNGSMLAMGALGYCYATGRGAPENDAEAYAWFSVAATSGLRRAEDDRDRFAQRLTGEQLGRAQEKASVLFDSILGPESPLAKAQEAAGS